MVLTLDVPAKKPRLDQITTGNIDADDVVDDDVSGIRGCFFAIGVDLLSCLFLG